MALAFAVPGIQIYLFRRTSPDLIANHMVGPTSLVAMLAQWILGGYVKVNRSSVKFANSSIIHLCHCQYEKDVTKYLGAEIHVLLIDELTLFTDSIYRFLRNRVRLAGLKIPAGVHWNLPLIVCGSNPGNIGHNWVKKTFVTFAPKFAKKRAAKKDGGMLRQFIPARLQDNPTLIRDDPGYEDRMEGLGSPELVKAMKDGNWDIVAGGMFDDVWDLDLNTCEPFLIPDLWPITRSFDWGSSKPFSVGWWTESNGEEVTLKDGSKRTWPKGHRFRIAEWYGWNGEDENVGCKMLAVDIAKGIVEREAKWGWENRVEPGAADSSIYDTDRGKSIGDEMEDEGVYFERADKGPGSRINGWELMRKMIKASHQRPQENPGLTVFNTGLHFIRCVPALPRDKTKTDDVDTNAEDHNGDESRYELSRVRGTATRVPMKGA